jgi:hypothetical protein
MDSNKEAIDDEFDCVRSSCSQFATNPGRLAVATGRVIQRILAGVAPCTNKVLWPVSSVAYSSYIESDLRQ